jgi:transcriptional regulator with AAA-type ATPase domain
LRPRHAYADVLLPSMDRQETLRAWGSRYVQLVLERNGRNKRKACRSLDISYHTLQAYLRYAQRQAAGTLSHAGRDRQHGQAPAGQ